MKCDKCGAETEIRVNGNCPSCFGKEGTKIEQIRARLKHLRDYTATYRGAKNNDKLAYARALLTDAYNDGAYLLSENDRLTAELQKAIEDIDKYKNAVENMENELSRGYPNN